MRHIWSCENLQSMIYLSNNTMTSLLALIMWAVITGNTVIEYGKQPLDIWLVKEVSMQEVEQPLFEWWSSWYDYSLNINWENVVWTRTHDVCALRIYERYKKYKVCTDEKCIVCKQTDYGPQRQDRVIDLSSHAFKQLAPLSKWVARVKVYLVK